MRDPRGHTIHLAGVVTCKDSMNEINIIPYYRIRCSQLVPFVREDQRRHRNWRSNMVYNSKRNYRDLRDCRDTVEWREAPEERYVHSNNHPFGFFWSSIGATCKSGKQNISLLRSLLSNIICNSYWHIALSGLYKLLNYMKLPPKGWYLWKNKFWSWSFPVIRS